jgi:hypothetical protein
MAAKKRGFETVLSRKRRATPAVARIFDGEKEAKLIALACLGFILPLFDVGLHGPCITEF